MIDTSVLTEIVAGVDQGYILLDDGGHVTVIGPRAAILLGVVDTESVLGHNCAEVLPVLGFEGAIFDGPESALWRCIRDGEEWTTPVSGVNVQTPTGVTTPWSASPATS
jgi:hypothetical protein